MVKKVLFILAAKDFRDAEYFIPAEILKKAGHQVFTASDIKTSEMAFGADGGEILIDYNIKEVRPEDFDLIIFVGGPGALKHLDNETSYELAQKALALEKYLAAICVAPVILAKAGVLKGKKAAVWSSPLDKGPVKILKEHGAFYEDKPVVSDNKIITANGPAAAQEFGEKLKSLLS